MAACFKTIITRHRYLCFTRYALLTWSWVLRFSQHNHKAKTDIDKQFESVNKAKKYLDSADINVADSSFCFCADWTRQTQMQVSCVKRGNYEAESHQKGSPTHRCFASKPNEARQRSLICTLMQLKRPLIQHHDCNIGRDRPRVSSWWAWTYQSFKYSMNISFWLHTRLYTQAFSPCPQILLFRRTYIATNTILRR